MKNLTISAAVGLSLAASIGFIFGYPFYAGFGEARNIATQAVIEARDTERVLQAYAPILIASQFYDELGTVKTVQDADALREKYRVAALKNIDFFERQASRLELPSDRALAAPFLDKATASRKMLEAK
jgi:hypothetical protein